MDELGQGGTSRLGTALSARMRCSAPASGTCSSPSTPTRARIRSRASSTWIMRGPGSRGYCTAGQVRITAGGPGPAGWLLGLAEDRLVLGDEPPPAQREEREK